jgi:hypothetical protein
VQRTSRRSVVKRAIEFVKLKCFRWLGKETEERTHNRRAGRSQREYRRWTRHRRGKQIEHVTRRHTDVVSRCACHRSKAAMLSKMTTDRRVHRRPFSIRSRATSTIISCSARFSINIVHVSSSSTMHRWRSFDKSKWDDNTDDHDVRVATGVHRYSKARIVNIRCVFTFCSTANQLKNNGISWASRKRRRPSRVSSERKR